MKIYGTINNLDVESIISEMSFGESGNDDLSEFEKFKKFQEFMKTEKKGGF